MKILACFDGSESSRRALEKAVVLFKPLKPQIILTMVSEIRMGEGGIAPETIEKGVAHDREVFDEAAGWVKGQGLDVDAVFELNGEPRSVTMKVIKSKAPDMVACGRRGRGRLAEMILGSVSAYLTRHSPCPVVVIR